MGACCTPISPPDHMHDANRVNTEIDTNLDRDHQDAEQVFKLLLLGAGESGKSTLLKQMRNIHGQAFKQEELLEAKPYIISNVIETFRTLALYSEMLYEDEALPTSVSPENEDIRTRVAMMKDKHPFTEQEYRDFKTLWDDEGIRETYRQRSRFQLMETVEYQVSRMHEYYKPDWIPNFTDLVHLRKRTAGVSKVSFDVRGDGQNTQAEKYEVYDVGGQRNERKKWMFVFDSVAAIIFVTSLSGYDQLLWEDNRVNRMKEALQLFDSIVNMACFENSHMILFLNKHDLFKDKIKDVSLRVCFPSYEGPDGDEEKAIEFIEQKFSERRQDSRKIIYSHQTCATDTKNIYRVFDSVRDIVVRNELGRAGLL